MTRQTDNAKIIGVLKGVIATYPNLRFIQLLEMVGIISDEDKYYEESDVTLDKMLKKIKELKP